MKVEKEMTYTIHKTGEYEEWFNAETAKSQVQIDKRLSNIEIYEHFGTRNDVGDDVMELKWDNGRRVYYAYIPEDSILVLLGGNKNGQQRDINRAKNIRSKYCS